MPWKGNDFQWSRDEAYADLTQGQYGSEYAEAAGRLVNLENGVRKYFADKLRTYFAQYHDHSGGGECGACGALQAAELLDPYAEKDPADAAEFGLTVLGPDNLQPE